MLFWSGRAPVRHPPENAAPNAFTGEKAKPSVSTPGGFAVCDFSATLTRDLYICCRNGLTESVPKQTVIRALTHGFRVEALHNRPRREWCDAPGFFCVRDRALRTSGIGAAPTYRDRDTNPAN